MKNFILFNLLIKYNNIGLNSIKLSYKWFHNNGFVDYYNELIYLTKFLNKDNISLSERIYCVIYDIALVKKCLFCNNISKYVNFVEGYKLHCGDTLCVKKLKNSILDENGLSANEKTRLGLIKYLYSESDTCSGMTNAQVNHKKGEKTKSILGSDGLDGNERAFKNGAGKNSSIIYYNNSELYYQGTYEKDFLDRLNILGLLSDVKRGDRIKYINRINIESIYRSDFSFRDIIFEIKSDYTYGSISYYHRKDDQINKLNDKRINNNLKYKYTLLQGKRLFIIMNKKYYLELNLNMLDDITTDLYKLEYKELINLNFTSF